MIKQGHKVEEFAIRGSAAAQASPAKRSRGKKGSKS